MLMRMVMLVGMDVVAMGMFVFMRMTVRMFAMFVLMMLVVMVVVVVISVRVIMSVVMGMHIEFHSFDGRLVFASDM